MTKQRANIGFADTLEDLKPTDWKPEPDKKPAKAKAPREEIRRVAQATGFKSREAVSAPIPAPTEEVAPMPVREGRIYRTGRSEQLNLKVRGVDKTGFYSICDRNHWVQGYTFQRAIEALERELKEAGQGTQVLTKSA
jgi:hypothetical protein